MARARKPPVFDIRCPVSEVAEVDARANDNHDEELFKKHEELYKQGKLTLQHLQQTPEQKAAFERATRNAFQFGPELRPMPQEFLTTCRRVGRALGKPAEEIRQRLERFKYGRFVRKTLVISGSYRLAVDLEKDPTGKNSLAGAVKQFEESLRRRIERERASVARFNAAAKRGGVPLIAPPKARRNARPDRGHVPVERKREWCALHFVFGWRVTGIQKSKRWNPERCSRQGIEYVLKELGAEYGLTRIDYRTRDERKKAEKPKQKL